MGEHEGWSEPVGQFLNGLLAVQGPVVRPLDAERWLRAEERTKELISCIQPNPQSEERRNAVADYVQQLITKCFPCQVCTFGSVPLKTYLPDGDIDLTAFSLDQNLKDTWANQVRDMLEKEEKNENAEFHVKEVQYIQAEVKIIKCLVENIVVDISFNQVGGLCTLCFLEEVDNRIGQNHLFKRSIILIKAWCYYESRILGATHGLISTYALETLVLYIFHVFNNSLQGPLEVLYRFLEFFSNFDWDRFCVSLWGPVPISSLPAMTAEHPRRDSGELLFTKKFLSSCSHVYAVFPAAQENNGQQFVSKHFNVIDPLRVTNNLGRSVSKGNFYRIRSAFAFGAKRLARLFDCSKENVVFEVNQFFMNTWERHGSGQRPDAAELDPRRTSLPTPDVRDCQTSNNEASRKKTDESISTSGVVVDGGIHRVVSSQYGDASARMIPTGEVAVTSHLPSLNSQNPPEAQRDVKQNHQVNDSHGRFLFARTCSSPELTDATNVSSQLRRNRQVESVNFQGPARPDANNRKKNVGSVGLATHIHHTSAKDASSVGNAPFLTGLDGVSANSNSRHQDSISDNLNGKFTSSAGSHMDQEEQDIVNMMASASLEGFNSQLHVPFGLSSAHIPFSMPPSFLASMGYTQRNLPGFIPSNIPAIDAPFSNVQYAHGFVSPQLSHHIPGVGVNSPRDASFEQVNENLSSAEMKAVDGDDDFWKEEGVLSSSGYESENGNGDAPVTDHKPQAPVSALKYIPPSRQSGSVRAAKAQQRHMRERGGSAGQNIDSSSNLDDISSDLYAEERSVSSRFSSVSRSNSVRSRTSSESSWDGSSIRTPKSSKERRLKRILSADQGPARGKGKVMSENLPNHAEPDGQGWVSSSDMGEIIEMSSRPEIVESLQAPRHHMPSLDVSQASGVDSMIPFAPMLIGRGSSQKSNDNSGLVAFYPTGPPIPFFTMLPLYNIPETESSEAPSGHFAGEEDPDANESKQDFSSERFSEIEVSNHSSSIRGRTSETSETKKADILHSDFDSHWKSLQFGRLCQNPHYPGPLVHPSPAMAPPVYFPGPIPYESSGRPASANLNLSQVMASYGRHLVPVAPLQPVSNRPPNVYQQHIDEISRRRSGTGTYLPNHKVAIRERHSSGGRRGNYRDDRSDLYGDRDGNWNANTKVRGGTRSHNRNQNDKKVDRMASKESGTDNSWNSYRHGPAPPYPLQNGPLSSNSSQNGSQNVNYSSYPLGAMNPNALSNGPVPPVVMFYPFSNNSGYGGEPLEFGSLGPVGFPGTEDQLQLNEGSQARAFDDHRIHGNSGHWSSPDQPSSPHYQSHRSRERG